ncbi:MAG TPA: penicillin acylase family protein [Candidatus Sulfotelmatobacter sp.]|nr:penicillin acylase family protein [Candidatus Sulfotelmatobacter sp.]
MIWILRGVALLLLIIGLALGGGYIYLHRSLPQLSGEVALDGLRGKVEIVRDRNAVPHIHAGSIADAEFALGYAHAQDRLWQMEMNRRIAAGRLAEIIGPRALDTDSFLRALGVRRAAAAAWAHLDPPTQAALSAYAAGVNAFIARRDRPLPPEFLMFGIRPEPWTPVDSIGWVKMMAYDLCRNWRDELFRLRLAARLTPQQIAEFLPPYPGDAPLAVSALAPLYRRLDGMATRLAAIAPPTLPRNAGSNNWVVAGRFSATGKPLLANDPQLGLTAPSLWYLADLEAPGLAAIGATLPGVPVVVLGHNARVAWGFTNTGSDVEDLYIEKLDPADPADYITPTGPQPFKTVSETIKVRGAPDVPFTVRVTRHGPVISDALGSAADAVGKGYVLALRWTALDDDDRTIQAQYHLMLAQNWDDFVAAARDVVAPQQNIGYADVDGNIGFIAPARVPIRKPENAIKGLAPSPGWEATYDWDGYIPFDKLPIAYNPPSGRVITANQKIVGDDYPYYLTSEWAEPYRARRIAALLAARTTHTVASFTAMQGDVRSLMAAELLPLLLRVPPDGHKAAAAVALLRRWDGSMAADRPEPLIFSAWMRELTRLVYADELGDLFPGAWQERPIFLADVLADRNGESRWCNDVAARKPQRCDSLVARALNLALDDLAGDYGSDISRWRWDDAHYARMAHRPFSRLPLLGWLFDITVPTPGDAYTIDAGNFAIANPAEPFASGFAPSFRAVYDLADLDRSLFIQPTGQSGNRLSPHYADFTGRWAKVAYLPMSTRADDIAEGALGTLTLLPAEQRP